MLTFDITDMKAVSVAQRIQDISDKTDEIVLIIEGSETITCAIPNSTTHQILIAQIRALRNDSIDEEDDEKE